MLIEMCVSTLWGTTIFYAGFVSQPRGDFETGPEAPGQIQSWNPGSCDGPPDGQYITVYNLCLIIYLVRTSFGGDSFGVFCVGFPESFSHGTLPDNSYRGWWECGYILNVLCLIICIVRTSFGGDSYRVFYSGFPGGFFTRYSA